MVLDYLETLPQVDMKHVAMFGYSRDGKMAAIATAIDERIAALIAGSTGVGGLLPWRLSGERGYGEGIETTTRSFPTWFVPRLRFFSGREDRLPVDGNLLAALIAPRASDAILSVASTADWEKKAAGIRQSVEWMLGDEPPMMPPGAGRGIPGGGRGAANPGQTTPALVNWVIQRGGGSFGWLEPQKSLTTSRPLSFGFNVPGDLYYAANTPANAKLPCAAAGIGDAAAIGSRRHARRRSHRRRAGQKGILALWRPRQAGALRALGLQPAPREIAGPPDRMDGCEHAIT